MLGTESCPLAIGAAISDPQRSAATGAIIRRLRPVLAELTKEHGASPLFDALASILTSGLVQACGPRERQKCCAGRQRPAARSPPSMRPAMLAAGRPDGSASPSDPRRARVAVLGMLWRAGHALRAASKHFPAWTRHLTAAASFAGEPLVPMDAQRLRVRDFNVGENLVYTPRSWTSVGFDDLRMLAKYYLVAAAIETRKDQIEKFDWSIVSRDPDSPRADAQRRIDELTEFWRHPDGDLEFATWLRRRSTTFWSLTRRALRSGAPAAAT